MPQLGTMRSRGMWCAQAVFVCLVLVYSASSGLAQTMRNPLVEPVEIDWSATASEFAIHREIIETARSKRRLSLFTRVKIAVLKWRFASLRSADLQATINALIGERFANVAASPTPVLLPFDAHRYLADRLSADGATATAVYLNGFTAYKFFRPGPSGYDASFNMPADEVAKVIGRATREDVAVTLSGSSLFYVLDDPTPPAGTIDTRFPELAFNVRRVVHERALRFTFMRYGAPYLVSIDCRPTTTAGETITCDEADKISERFLRALRLVGGALPKKTTRMTELITIDRPKCADAEFTYHKPGDLTPGSSYKNLGGKADYTVYARMAFPVASPRAYANSQVFMHGGECLSDPPLGITAIPPPQNKGDAYHCTQNPTKFLTFFEGAKENFSYPWRDNFCESRDWPLGQCPGNMGHQGQDVRPDTCYAVSPTSVRCEPYRHRINAVRDGFVQRERGREALYLVVNSATEHLRFRYLHMNPAHLDRDGMITGRDLSEGTRIGLMGTYFDGHENGTSYHLHFDVQAPTRDGWLYVSPYMTLVAAYERQINRKGTEIKADGSRGDAEASAKCR